MNGRKKRRKSAVFLNFATEMNGLSHILRHVAAALGLMLASHGALAQTQWNAAYQQYIDQYKDLAIEQMMRHHVPASITLAQGLLESGAGQSQLARRSNNHFGIKCHGTWTGKRVYADDDNPDDCFRSYNTVYDSYEDHSLFLARGQRYSSLFQLKATDYKGWAYGLKRAGYATNPKYASRLIEIIQVYKLYQYDTAKDYDHFYARHTRDRAAKGGTLHAIHAFNENYYVEARRGDTFETIGREVGVSARKLARYNERDRHATLAPGDLVYLKKKRKKAPKSYKGRLHYVRQGQSMYTIAQTYGMRLKSLYKLNGLSPDYQIAVGDALRVR